MDNAMNGTLLQAFSWYLPADGGHWERVAARARDMAEKGVTAVWLPPAYKGAAGMEDVGYGVYDLYDLGEFDQKGSVPTKYGTREGFLSCTKALHDEGLKVIVDVVLNQRLGADERERVRARAMDPDNRLRAISDWQEIEAWSKFTFPGRQGAYSDFVWDWHCFHGTDYNALNGERGVYLFEGKHWDDDVTHEFGNFDYLMGCDVDLLYPPVYNELVRWGLWFVGETGAEGVRLDAVKHMERSFYLMWLRDVRAALGRDLFAVGEYWDSDIDDLRGYLGAEQAMSLFDVYLHYRFHDISESDGTFDLRRVFDGTLVASDPAHAVTFVDNHDTQHGQSLQSTVDDWFKPSAYALILLREAGYPCVFYGDLYGTPQVRAVPGLGTLMRIRASLAWGQQHDWFDDPDVIGWTREGDREHEASGCAVVISDRRAGSKRMYVGASHAREYWKCALGLQSPVRVDERGWAEFSVADGGLSVYVSEHAEALLRAVERP